MDIIVSIGRGHLEATINFRYLFLTLIVVVFFSWVALVLDIDLLIIGLIFFICLILLVYHL